MCDAQVSTLHRSMEKQSYELIAGLGKYYKTHVIAYQNSGNKTIWFTLLRAKIEAMLKAYPGISLIHLNDGSMGAASLWLQKSTPIPVVVTITASTSPFRLRSINAALYPGSLNTRVPSV